MENAEDIRQQVLHSTFEEVKNQRTEDYSDPCVICLDTVSERATATPCGHNSFDFLCLLSWLQERPACPLCKSTISTVEYERISEQDFKTFIVEPQQKTSHESLRQPPQATDGSNYGRYFQRPPRPRRQQPQGPPPSPDTALLKRRQVYRNQLYSLHVGSNRLSRFKDLTPQMFSSDKDLLSRARKWIRRELRVFEFLNPNGAQKEGIDWRANNAEFLLEYIIAILKTVDVKGSGGQAEDMLQEFLGRDNTRLFLHELRAWLRSPYVSLEDWDRHVQYSTPDSGSVASIKGQLDSSRRDGSPPASIEIPMKKRRSSFRGDYYRPPSGSYYTSSSKRRASERYLPDR
ncbi:MAG: hypothetical protein MMC33_001682 [Icmadophila ericetorum]|nr:hypothetical protein [Icmadophila ericetorum]